MRSPILFAFSALSLAACGGGGEEANNSGVTREEAVALDNAANMLDTSPDSLVAIDDSGMGNGEVSSEEIANAGDVPDAENATGNTQ